MYALFCHSAFFGINKSIRTTPEASVWVTELTGTLKIEVCTYIYIYKIDEVNKETQYVTMRAELFLAWSRLSVIGLRPQDRLFVLSLHTPSIFVEAISPSCV